MFLAGSVALEQHVPCSPIASGEQHVCCPLITSAQQMFLARSLLQRSITFVGYDRNYDLRSGGATPYAAPLEREV
jgi:hypothetical protein